MGLETQFWIRICCRIGPAERGARRNQRAERGALAGKTDLPTRLRERVRPTRAAGRSCCRRASASPSPLPHPREEQLPAGCCFPAASSGPPSARGREVGRERGLHGAASSAGYLVQLSDTRHFREDGLPTGAAFCWGKGATSRIGARMRKIVPLGGDLAGVGVDPASGIAGWRNEPAAGDLWRRRRCVVEGEQPQERTAPAVLYAWRRLCCMRDSAST